MEPNCHQNTAANGRVSEITHAPITEPLLISPDIVRMLYPAVARRDARWRGCRRGDRRQLMAVCQAKGLRGCKGQGGRERKENINCHQSALTQSGVALLSKKVQFSGTGAAILGSNMAVKYKQMGCRISCDMISVPSQPVVLLAAELPAADMTSGSGSGY